MALTRPISVTWPTGTDAEVDVVAFLTDADQQVRADADFVFYNQPASADGSVELTLDVRHEAEIRLDGVHAPELVQAGGIETREYVSGWMAAHMAKDRTWPFWVEVVMTTTYEPAMRQSFTRYVGTLWPFDQRNQAVLSLAHNMAQENGLTAGMIDVITEYVKNKTIKPDEAVTRLADAVESAR